MTISHPELFGSRILINLWNWLNRGPARNRPLSLGWTYPVQNRETLNLFELFGSPCNHEYHKHICPFDQDINRLDTCYNLCNIDQTSVQDWDPTNSKPIAQDQHKTIGLTALQN